MLTEPDRKIDKFRMLGRTSALIRSSLTNSIRHGSHGGVPGEVGRLLEDKLKNYITRRRRLMLWVFVTEPALPTKEPLPPDGLVHLLLWIGNRFTLRRCPPSVIEGLNPVRDPTTLLIIKQSLRPVPSFLPPGISRKRM